MKRLTVSALALVLATSAGSALADRRHGNYHDGHGHRYNHGHYNRSWYPQPFYPRVYHYSHHDHYYHHSDYHVPLGAALIGAAVTYSIVHSRDAGHSERVASNDVVGCHRIERYADGSERRVEVPLAECY